MCLSGLLLVSCATTTSGSGRRAIASVVSSDQSASTPSIPPSIPAPSKTVRFHGVTVTNALTMNIAPEVTSHAAGAITHLYYLDLVVGDGAAAAPTATVTLHYVGVLYSDGLIFDSSWERGQPARIPLQHALPGFAQAVVGTTGIPPMRVGGRRIMILPAQLAYGSRATGPIPANSTLAFVVDLLAAT